GGDGILGVLLYAIAMFLLEILGAIIEAMNNMVFPYVAVYGTSYTESINGSFSIVTASDCKGLATFSAFAYAVYPFVFIFAIVSVIMNLLLIGYDTHNQIALTVIFSVLFIALFNAVVAMICSGVRGLIFSKIEFAEELESYVTHLSGVMEEKNTRLIES
ncbi:hypothetical protein PAPHI01_2369, partial [Pancytospora philotis]